MAHRSIVALFALSIVAPMARAEGELGPMVGAGIVGTRASDDLEVAGVTAELVLWYGRLGIAAEGSRQWSVDGANGPQVGTVAGSLRILVFDRVTPSLLDPRDVVEVGIELQGIVERAWWQDVASERDPTSQGLGVAVRLRGATEDDRSNLIAESRLFVRVMRSDDVIDDGVAARDTSPQAERGGFSVMFGLGALWGGGRPGYVAQLRRRNALDSEWLVAR